MGLHFKLLAKYVYLVYQIVFVHKLLVRLIGYGVTCRKTAVILTRFKMIQNYPCRRLINKDLFFP